MAANAGTPVIGRRKHHRRKVMSEINVTPMVDVMLVLLIIFMVSAPLLTVGVPIDLPQTQAKSLDQDKEPLTLSVNDKGKVFLQNAEIAIDDLVPKLQAVAQARGGTEARILCARRQKGRLRDHDEGDGAAVVGRLPSRRLGHRIRAGLESTVMRTASAISTGLHAAVLLWALVSFSGKTFEVTPAESLPVDLVSDKDFSEMTKGAKDAPKPGRDAEAAGREEGRAEAGRRDRAQAHREERAQGREGKDGRAQARSDRRQAQEAGRAEAGSQGRAAAAAAEEAAAKQQPKFDADKIAALLDKRDPQRNAATGAELNPTPSLGAASGNAAKLSQSEIDALRARLMALWNPPVGMQDAEQIAGHHPDQVQARRHAGDRPAGSDQRQRRALQRDARQRGARGLRRPALHHAAPRALRDLERNRLHLRHQAKCSTIFLRDDNPMMTNASNSHR